jgi:hypothetical protein
LDEKEAKTYIGALEGGGLTAILYSIVHPIIHSAWFIWPVFLGFGLAGCIMILVSFRIRKKYRIVWKWWPTKTQ